MVPQPTWTESCDQRNTKWCHVELRYGVMNLSLSAPQLLVPSALAAFAGGLIWAMGGRRRNEARTQPG